MKSNESNLSPELANKLKILGISESDTKEQIAKILSENNVGLLQELLSDPSLNSGLKQQIEGALGDYGGVSQSPQFESKDERKSSPITLTPQEESKEGGQADRLLITVKDPDYKKGHSFYTMSGSEEEARIATQKSKSFVVLKAEREGDDNRIFYLKGGEVIELKPDGDEKCKETLDKIRNFDITKNKTHTFEEFSLDSKSFDELVSSLGCTHQEENKKPRGTIQQFTQEGLRVATSYYNQKYPDRGEIHGVLAFRPKEDLNKVDQAVEDAGNNEKDPNVVRIFDEMNERVATQCIEDFGSLPPLSKGETRKIILTVTSGDKLAHSVPVVLTEDKFIVMRTDNNQNIQGIMPKVAEGMGLEFVQPNYHKDKKPTAIQADSSSCHFIALGTLKDLTKEDLEVVANLNDEFASLPKSVKYSQSSGYIKDAIDEKSAGDAVKKDGRTAAQYAKQHKKIITPYEITTRITDKIDKFQLTLNEVASNLPEGSNIDDIASEVLKENRAQSFAKNNTNGRNKRGDDEFNNSAISKQIGGHFAGGGVRDIDQPKSPENTVNKDTMFAEGSIGKVRYAGLAYMMQQEGVFGEKGLQQNAREFFESEAVGKLLEDKYPEKNMQSALLKLFADGSEKATIADLTTHRSGIGDTTEDTKNRMSKSPDSLDHNFTLPDLVLENEYSVVPRVDGKPQAKKGLKGDLSRAVYGDHEYSNLGYQVLAEVMELAYEIQTGDRKNYQQLTDDFMLHPKEGRAKDSGLSFNRTKFPRTESFEKDDNVVQAKLLKEDEKEGGKRAKTVNHFNGAHAGGGIFTSASDSAGFFTEYFKGFPGTPEYGKENANKFFSKDTIDSMAMEAFQHKSLPNQPAIDDQKRKLEEWDKANPTGEETQDNKKPRIPNPEYQLPGVVMTTDGRDNPHSYVKGGGTEGYIARLEFNARNGVDISMISQENLTPAREKEAEKIREASVISEISTKVGLSPNQLKEIYQLPDENGKVDIKSMAKDFDNGKGVEKIQEKQKEFEQKGALEEKQQKESFVEKLGLEKNGKPESFVERMQAGKHGNIGSKGGAHEL